MGGEPEDPGAEKAWLHHFNAVKSAHDHSSAKTTVILLVIWSPLMVSGRDPAIFAALYALYSFLCFKALRQPWYIKRREFVVNCRQMATIISFYAFVMRSEPFMAYLTPPPPAESGPSWFSSLRSLMLLPLMLLAVGANYATPLRSKRIILAAALASCLPANIAVCRAAAAGQRYRDILCNSEAVTQWIVPIQVIEIVNASGRALFDAPALSEYGACMAVHSSLQAAVGFFLPLAVMGAEEGVLRAEYERNHLGGTGAAYALRCSTALHLLTAVLEAGAAFHAILRVIHLLGMAGVAPTLLKSLF